MSVFLPVHWANRTFPLYASLHMCIIVYLQSPPVLRAALEPNLVKSLGELVEDGDVLSVTDPLYPKVFGGIDIKVKFVE